MCSRKSGPPHVRPAPLGAARGPLEGLGYTQAVPAPLCLRRSHLTRENLEHTKEFWDAVTCHPQTSQDRLLVGLEPLLPPLPDQPARERHWRSSERKCRILCLLNWQLSSHIGFQVAQQKCRTESPRDRPVPSVDHQSRIRNVGSLRHHRCAFLPDPTRRGASFAEMKQQGQS